MGEIESVAECLPLAPRDGTIDELLAEGFLNNNVLLYRAAWVQDPLTGIKHKMVQATCTACGETFYMDYAAPHTKSGTFGFICDSGVFYTGDACDCPQCGMRVQVLHIGRFKYDYTIDNVWFTTAENAAGHLAFALWECEKRINKDGDVFYKINRIEAQACADGRIYRLMGRSRNMSGYVYYGGWHIAKRFSWVRDFNYTDTLLYLTDDLVDAAAEEKSACAVFGNSGADNAECLLGKYMRLWQKFPCVENLVRQGYSAYVAGVIKHITEGKGYYRTTDTFDPRKASKYLDTKKCKPHEILGLDKTEFVTLRGIDFEPMEIYKKVKRIHGVRLTKEQAIAAALRRADTILEETTCFGRKIRPVRLINYLEKEKTSAQDLYDYWNMTDAVYGELPESMMYPKNFQNAHDDILKRKKEKENAVISEKIKKRAEKAAYLTYSDDETGLMIRPAASHAELIREGKLLKHCVATYASGVAEGKTLILFVRRIADPDTPYFTLEYKNGKVAQNRGYKNCERTPEVKIFEKKWLEYIEKGDKKNGRKNGTDAKCA